MYILKLIPVPNFSSLGCFSFSSTFISCHQLLTAVDSWWQLIWKKFNWNFYVHTKMYSYAKFQLSRLIFIFISCQQLLTAVDSWWQLSQIFFDGIFIYPLKLILVPNFSSSGCLGAQLESVTYGRTDVRTDRRQVRIVLTQPWSAGARGWVGQYYFLKLRYY